jgi:long-chain-fatty-acid--[acyl-carrier-protein] ligase
MEYHVACADERMGVVSYRKLKMIVLSLAYHFQQIQEKRVGVLLPASTVSYAIVLGLMLAGKVPVMLNWTVGVRALSHCKKVAGLQQVISSRRFLEHLTDGDLGDIDEMMTFAEDIRSSLSFKTRIKAVWSLFKDTPHLLKDLKLHSMQETDSAVILFTSGTESFPKGVPLSHENILSNHRAALSCVTFHTTDVLYGVLPPFHSFGFSVTGLLPLLAGLKVFYAPDPTQYHSMRQDIKHWKITLLCSAPTFIKGLFQVARRDDLSSLRLVVGGAEKVPEELFEYMSKTKGMMLEGYGITECSPVVTLSRPGAPREGVGPALPGINLKVIHPETLEEVSQGIDGEICIHGPNVFSGYLDEQPSPFIEIEGKKWYRSGDYGHLTPSHSLVLTGRLKRFIKIGGEMISLSSIEEELSKHAQLVTPYMQSQKGPLLAVISKHDAQDKPMIVVFTTLDVSEAQLNEILREKGFGRLIKIGVVKKIDEIPLTGTGKIDYRKLQQDE